MITLKTKSKHKVPYLRQIIDGEVYLKVARIEVSEAGIVTHGYYYIIQDGAEQLLDHITPSLLSWEHVAMAEEQLQEVQCTHFKTVVFQRVKEFAVIKLQTEGTSNYGITPDNWEIVTENTQDNEEVAN